MSYRSLAFALVASLLASGALTVALSGSAYAQEDNVWYPGEGVKLDMFVTYRIQEFDTNEGRPYEMTMYFQEQQDGDWIVPTFVLDEDGRVISGTMKLSDSMAYLAGGSNVPQEMNDYIGGYSGSLHWIDSFTTKAEPKSLSPGTNWGRTGSIGGSDVVVSGPQTITVEAGSVDTTLLTLHKGVTSRIWLQNGFPFPVKAQFFTDSATGSQQIQYEFELLETGTGKPETPTGAKQIPTPPLTSTTVRGDFKITLDWEPASMHPGTPVLYTVSLTDDSGFPLERANYDFVIMNSSGGIIQEFNNQNADAEFGTGTHEVQFNSAGGFKATVTINAISGQGTGQFTESADFNMVVVPEFPLSAAIMAAVVIGLVVLIARARGASVGGLFSNRGAP